MTAYLVPAHVAEEDLWGHMAISWMHDSAMLCRGFYPDKSSPQLAEVDFDRLADYLFNHRVDGIALDDREFALRAQKSAAYMQRQWPFFKGTQSIEVLSWVTSHSKGYYSFNPHTHQADNCVTWATKRINEAAGQVIEPVREGRVKEIVKQLRGEPFDKANSDEESADSSV